MSQLAAVVKAYSEPIAIRRNTTKSYSFSIIIARCGILGVFAKL